MNNYKITRVLFENIMNAIQQVTSLLVQVHFSYRIIERIQFFFEFGELESGGRMSFDKEMSMRNIVNHNLCFGLITSML